MALYRRICKLKPEICRYIIYVLEFPKKNKYYRLLVSNSTFQSILTVNLELLKYGIETLLKRCHLKGYKYSTPQGIFLKQMY